jgi:hypothetical protein
MDLLIGLPAVGTYFNNNEHKTKYLEYGTAIKRTPINGTNIYESNNYRENKNYVAHIAYERYQDAQNPKLTGVIPNFYNQLVAVQKRWEEQKEKIVADQVKRKEIILTDQKTDVDNRNLKYKNIMIKGILPCFLLLIFIFLTM